MRYTKILPFLHMTMALLKVVQKNLEFKFHNFKE